MSFVQTKCDTVFSDNRYNCLDLGGRAMSIHSGLSSETLTCHTFLSLSTATGFWCMFASRSWSMKTQSYGVSAKTCRHEFGLGLCNQLLTWLDYHKNWRIQNRVCLKFKLWSAIRVATRRFVSPAQAHMGRADHSLEGCATPLSAMSFVSFVSFVSFASKSWQSFNVSIFCIFSIFCVRVLPV